MGIMTSFSPDIYDIESSDDEPINALDEPLVVSDEPIDASEQFHHEDQDICAICHEDFTGELYTLPECSHIFHTNCIMTWFRMKKTSCPLCNNNGVNSMKHMEK